MTVDSDSPDAEFLDHCVYMIKGVKGLDAKEAARLFKLAGDFEIADVLMDAAGFMHYYLPITGLVLVASARAKLAEKDKA